MATVFWDRKGALMVEFMQQGATVKSKVHCEKLKKLLRPIQNKRRGMQISSVVLLHDNVLKFEHCQSFSTGSCLITLLTTLISLLSDYHLFTYLKK
jgi:hypothetical protein